MKDRAQPQDARPHRRKSSTACASPARWSWCSTSFSPPPPWLPRWRTARARSCRCSTRRRRAPRQRRGAGACVLSGELYAETLPGFVHPAPLALVAHGVKGKTRDLLDHQRHRRHDASRRRGARLLRRAAQRRPRSSSTCSRTHAARDRASSSARARATTSTSRISTAPAASSSASPSAWQRRRPFGCGARRAHASTARRRCRKRCSTAGVGRMMSGARLAHEVEFACRVDAFPVVPALDEGAASAWCLTA